MPRNRTVRINRWTRSLFWILFIIAIGVHGVDLTWAEAEKGTYPLRDLVEFTPREGLPNFFAKLNEGKAVKVGYLGGSITAQNGWRVLSLEWLKKKFPNCNIQEINAAIGGTGSDLGVFRVEADVLKERPDLIFVEFAVNDSSASPENIRKSMEGIVRKTWRLLPGCDICFVYTLTATDADTYQVGKAKRSTTVMEEVADYYKLPSVNFAVEIARLVKSETLIMKGEEAPMDRVSGDELNQEAQIPKDSQGKIIFSKDGVHPFINTGHVIYLQTLVRALTALQPIGKPGSHTLGDPLIADNWEDAKQLLLAENVTFSGKASQLAPNDAMAKRFSKQMPAMWKLEPGASLSFKFTGTKVALYDITGPDSGSVEISVDGKTRKVLRFDKYCTYSRLSVLPIADNLENKEHEVIIKVLSVSINKEDILMEAGRKAFQKSPDQFAGLNWYVGTLFLVGAPVPNQSGGS